VTATMSSRLLLGLLLVLGVVGILDTSRERHWDAVVLFVAVVVVAAMLLVRSWVGTPLVAVRADLVRWLDHRSAESDEHIGAVASRAIAAYRDGLTGTPAGGGAPRRDHTSQQGR
jgi:hypothetical protein